MEGQYEQENEWGVPTHLEREADRLYSGLTSLSEISKKYCPNDVNQIISCNSRKYRIE